MRLPHYFLLFWQVVFHGEEGVDAGGVRKVRCPNTFMNRHCSQTHDLDGGRSRKWMCSEFKDICQCLVQKWSS